MPLGQKKTSTSGLGRSKPPSGTMNPIKMGDYVKTSMGVGKVIALPNPKDMVPMYSIQLSSGTVVEYAPEYVQPIEKHPNQARSRPLPFRLKIEWWDHPMREGGLFEWGTIRTDPENYYVASIMDNNTLIFRDIEAMTRGIDQKSVVKWYLEQNVKLPEERLSKRQIVVSQALLYEWNQTHDLEKVREQGRKELFGEEEIENAIGYLMRQELIPRTLSSNEKPEAMKVFIEIPYAGHPTGAGAEDRITKAFKEASEKGWTNLQARGVSRHEGLATQIWGIPPKSESSPREENLPLYLSSSEGKHRVIYRGTPVMADTTDLGEALRTLRITAEREGLPYPSVYWDGDKGKFVSLETPSGYDKPHKLLYVTYYELPSGKWEVPRDRIKKVEYAIFDTEEEARDYIAKSVGWKPWGKPSNPPCGER